MRILLYMQPLSRSDSTNVAVFDHFVSRRIQKALLKSIFNNYRHASDHCFTTFQSPQVAKDLSGDYRRAKIEEEWSGIAAVHRDIKVTLHFFENNTGCYNEITCGRVKITQSCTTSPGVVPRFALFRKTLASSGQLAFSFSDEGQATEDTEDAYLYAILTHGVDVEVPKRSRPWFARIQFPNDDCSCYVDRGIDLFKRFPELVAEYVPEERIEIEPQEREKRITGTAV